MKSPCTCACLDTRDRQTDSSDLSVWDGSDAASMGVKVNGLFFMKHFVGQQTDLEQYSKYYG